ncbi:hypothetical protein CLAFUW4_03710 [Fulvia fulva]|uniref:Uncharacterized protein n=1 Tax=Passalora fulva TaxID=5499 RepID=A0A9Q8LBU6_PASFU|nr:uncharacterized protein CLAFUR5_03686 [Fulvia fulva]KAK4631769.1 hypothetical protein CLAFUR4_03698 [Fulvia fulva]KAK4632997.1 hypothetical protein CLAFUR0_03701 [Fulvia fulva]UJO14600.1 hypothetical protein CLAFUR5_03686 [Fulvia fulva]WPV11243.1 hypothetical protein CLAFUW4_03710 [Fulvia fulva]WPV25484.1 hypothetical protein CLAFUW7_03702 [Fulvia fulva]
MAFAKSGTVAERALWESVEVSCTCRRFLGDLPMPNNKYICKEHLEKNWNRLQAARDATNAWLTGLERRGGKMAVARAATVTMRTNNGEQRACPCGREVNHAPPYVAEFAMCMACLGVRTLNPGNPVSVQVPFATQLQFETAWKKFLKWKKIRTHGTRL